MASARQSASEDEWRLGIEPGESHERGPDGEAEEPAQDLSAARLERPLQVVTVEHAGWLAIAAWTLLTRLPALAARPLAPAEARNALCEYDLAFRTREAASAGYHAAWGGWVHLAQAGIFAALGASDFTARLIFVLAGLLLVAMAFEMRHYLGRAGALGLGTMLAVSPSLTYFSRASATAVPAAALSLVTIAIFMAVVYRPGIRRTAALGCTGGLMVAADPSGLVTAAIFLSAFAVLGASKLLISRKVYLRVRVWLDRYATLAAVGIVTGVSVWVLSELVLSGEAGVGDIARTVQSLCAGIGRLGYREGFHFYAPALAIYEFLIAIAGLAGAIVIVALRVRSRFATFCLLWAIASLGYYLWAPVNESAWVVQIILPAAMVGAFAVEYVHHTYVWRFVRYPIAIVLIFSIYAQVMANFVYPAPDVSEAAWARHANLFWSQGATTLQARERIAEALKPVNFADATAFIGGQWPPALRWYLRNLQPASSADSASVTVKTLSSAGPADSDTNRFAFDFEESWQPQLGTLDAARLIQFMLTARPWGELVTRSVALIVRPTGSAAPTVILVPHRN